MKAEFSLGGQGPLPSAPLPTYGLRERCLVYQSIEPFLVPAQLILAMLGMGATMTVADFGSVGRDPRGLAIGLALQWLYVPAVAMGFIHVFGLSQGWAVGLLLVSAVPGGAFSNLLTFLGRGNVPLSIAVTSVTTLGSVLAVPLILQLGAGAILPPDFHFPIPRVMAEIFGYLLAPLAFGMAIRKRFPGAAPGISRWAIRGSLALVITIAVASLGTGRIRLAESGFGPPLIIVLFGTFLAVSIPQLCRLLGRFDDDTVALTIEVAVRNVGLGLLVVHFFFPGQKEQGMVLFSALFYAGASPAFAIPAMLRHRFGKSAVLLRRPKPRPQPASNSALSS
ncbi:MAG TPA: bile acid:sodium symporter [Polyangiaceae bacterium]|nr:bile acid:sodium symporter [Polyangiaceae bacterium]